MMKPTTETMDRARRLLHSCRVGHGLDSLHPLGFLRANRHHCHDTSRPVASDKPRHQDPDLVAYTDDLQMPWEVSLAFHRDERTSEASTIR